MPKEKTDAADEKAVPEADDVKETNEADEAKESDEAKEVKETAGEENDGKSKKKSSKGSKSQKAKYEEEIASLKEELEKQKDIFLRTAAEYDNYRKRTEREKTNVYNDATVAAVKTLLPAIDSLQMAVNSVGDASDDHAKGLKMIMAQMQEALKKLNVEEYGERGDEFNPELHNAVAQVEDAELEENQIAAVFQKGYKIGDKIVRHAMVQVAAG